MIRPRKLPLRLCLGCRDNKPKKNLMRIVIIPNGELAIDLSGKMAGRGAYICSDKNCLKKALKSKGIEKNLKKQITPEFVQKIEKVIDENSNSLPEK